MIESGWDTLTSGPPDADHTVLLLPGAFATAAFYEDLMAEPALAGVRLVAATLPGQGGTPVIGDLSIESYAALAAKLATELGCSAVVGHSTGANVAIEMAATGAFTGPLVLLAPSLSRRDESIIPRILDKLGLVLGNLPFLLLRAVIGPFLKSSFRPEHRATLLAAFRRNSPTVMRTHLHRYLTYLDEHRTLAPTLCQTGVPTWLLYGANDDVTIAPDERHTLDTCPTVTVITLPDTRHFLANEQPAEVATLLRQVLDDDREEH
jgi:pimeloyl-ACP methyl ester carboxylesterase